MFERLVHLIDGLSDRAGQTSAFMVVPLFLIMGYEISARFIFDLPTFWAYELGYMVTGLHYVFGIAYVTKMKQHIRLLRTSPSEMVKVLVISNDGAPAGSDDADELILMLNQGLNAHESLVELSQCRDIISEASQRLNTEFDVVITFASALHHCRFKEPSVRKTALMTFVEFLKENPSRVLFVFQDPVVDPRDGRFLMPEIPPPHGVNPEPAVGTIWTKQLFRISLSPTRW